MKKFLSAAAVLVAATFFLSGCSDDSSPSLAESCTELSKDCLKGTWNISSMEGSMGDGTAYAGYGILKLTGSSFTYTPAVNDQQHTYCPTQKLTGSYEILNATQVEFTVDGLALVGSCFYQSSAKVTVVVTPETLTITGGSIGNTLFVPNSEGFTSEVYTRQ